MAESGSCALRYCSDIAAIFFHALSELHTLLAQPFSLTHGWPGRFTGWQRWSMSQNRPGAHWSLPETLVQSSPAFASG